MILGYESAFLVGVSAAAIGLGACSSSSSSGDDSSATGGTPTQVTTGGASSGGQSSGGSVTTAAGGSLAASGGTLESGGGGVSAGGAVAEPTGGTSGGTDSSSGGAGVSGGTSGGAGTAGAGTSAGDSPCGVAPANPNATKQAKALLCYIYSLYGKSVISGQQETSWSNPGNDISWYNSNGMKYPAILGGDYLYPSGTTQRAIAYWQAGGLTMIRYHMGAPPKADTYENAESSSNIDNVLKSGTSENTSFNSKLDYVAGELKKLQDANAAVIWAPFHEVQPNGWFWWAKGTGTQFIGLWKYMFNYLTMTKGLNNLVWLLPFSGSPNSGYYPGKQYLDLAGPDIYATNQPYTSLYSSAKNVIGGTIPIPLHETGMIPTPSQMFPSSAPWVLFNIWAGYENDGQHNTTSNIKSVYADSHTITRDELPNLK